MIGTRLSYPIILATAVLFLGACAAGPGAVGDGAVADLDEQYEVWHCDRTFSDCGMARVDDLRVFCDGDDALACERLGDAADAGALAGEDGDVGLERACELDRPGACRRLGRLHAERGDEQGAHAFFARACERGLGEACSARGELAMGNDDVAGAFGHFLAGCRGDDENSCVVAGELMAYRIDEIIETLTRRCDDDDAEACANLATFFRIGEGVERDREYALSLLEDSCADGSDWGCAQLGGLRSQMSFPFDLENPPAAEDMPDVIEVDMNAQVRNLDISCQGGDAMSCYQVAQFYNHGSVVEADAERALALYDRACRLGMIQACQQRVAVLLTGEASVQRDTEGAFDYLLTLCARGTDNYCYTVGHFVLSDESLHLDLARAYNVFRMTCLDGESNSCVSAGVLRATGEGISTDFDMANQYYRRACDAEIAMGCANLATLYFFGQGLERDVERARELLTWACDAGEAAGCQRLHDFFR